MWLDEAEINNFVQLRLEGDRKYTMLVQSVGGLQTWCQSTALEVLEQDVEESEDGGKSREDKEGSAVSERGWKGGFNKCLLVLLRTDSQHVHGRVKNKLKELEYLSEDLFQGIYTRFSNPEVYLIEETTE